MYIYHFQCRLLSEVVLQQSTATEGFQSSLDYIPGVKFLGIAAKGLYDQKDAQTLDLFHNGKVQFGNAYPKIDGSAESSVPVPFCWFKPKQAEDFTEVFVRGSYTETKETKEWDKEHQPKQMRVGYISEGRLAKIEQGFSLKSAYDRKKRRSAESQMYGYSSLPKGSLWQFTVRSENKDYLEKVKESLKGTHTIGRSRTAQYGLVEITFIEEKKYESTEITDIEKNVWIYAKSDCAFFDGHGNPTYQPKPAQLGLPEGSTIDWEKSQIRTREYSVWNGKRNLLDPRRSVISKGSVWVCKVENEFSTDSVELGVGSFQAEGLGQLLVEPSFLEVEEGKKGELKTKVKKGNISIYQPKEAQSKATDTSKLLEWIKLVSKEKASAESIREDADNFLQDNKALFQAISKSQWGHIRSVAKRFNDWKSFLTYLFGNEEEEKKKEEEDKVIVFGYTQHGVSEAKWRSSGRAAKLKGQLEKIHDLTKKEEDRAYTQEQAFEFIQYFANQMSKKAND